MRNELKSHGGRLRRPLYVATLLALFGAGAAGAADTAPMLPNKDGLLILPNVRVVNAPQLATAPVAQSSQAGMKAYIDPTTGQLRQPTEEDLVAESQAAQRAQTLTQQRFQQGTEFVTRSGAIGMRLDDSFMSYSGVQKTESGALVEFCVVGPEQAAKAMNLKAPELSALQRKESRNDR
jgi:hypothetical protein